MLQNGHSGFPLPPLLELLVSELDYLDYLVIQALRLSPAEYLSLPEWLRVFSAELLLGGGA